MPQEGGSRRPAPSLVVQSLDGVETVVERKTLAHKRAIMERNRGSTLVSLGRTSERFRTLQCLHHF